MSAETVERATCLWNAAYVAGQRLIEARATWERLYDAEDDWDQAAYTAAERCMHEAMDILLSLLRAAGLPRGAVRLVHGAEGLMELTMREDEPAAVWREEPVDVRPVRPEALWAGRRLPVTAHGRGSAPIRVEVEHASVEEVGQVHP